MYQSCYNIYMKCEICKFDRYIGGENMKYVRCNNCGEEYYIFEGLDKMGFSLGNEKCEMCGKTDYTVLDNDVKVKYYPGEKEESDLRKEDMIQVMGILKEELLELIKSYIDPWIK